MLPVTAGAQQVPADLARERGEYARWLATAATSPYAAQALLPVGTGISLGPSDADVVLPGASRALISEKSGALTLERGGARTPLARGRLVPLDGPYRVLAAGLPGRTAVTVFGPLRDAPPPTYHPYAADASLRVTLVPPPAARTVALLGPDGTELRAAEAGTVSATWRGQPLRLTVRRLPGATEDESELQVFFRDRTSARGSYDGGRFVELLPQPDGTLPARLQSRPQPVLRLQQRVPVPRAVARQHARRRVAAGERYEPRRPEAPGTVIATPCCSRRPRRRSPARGAPRSTSPAARSSSGSRSRPSGSLAARPLCNGTAVRRLLRGAAATATAVRFELADYAASITAVLRGDSLVGVYRNVGNRGPRSHPVPGIAGTLAGIAGARRGSPGSWYAHFHGSVGGHRRAIFEFRNGPAGLEGTIIGNAGDYSHFSGEATSDSFALSRFDGSFVYLLTGRLVGDTLRGTFHAGSRRRRRSTRCGRRAVAAQARPPR